MRERPPEPIVILGGGGHGRETVSLIREAEARTPGRWQLLGVVADDHPDIALFESLGVNWLGPVDRLLRMPVNVSIAVGDGGSRSQLQRNVTDHGCSPATLVHPTASIGLDIEMGEGCYVGALTVVTSNVRLGKGVQVNVSCSLSHDVIVGDFATLAPGVHLAGGVIVGECATIFTGATVLPHVRVGRGAVVGAGAVVIKDVPAGQTVVGVPARTLVQERRAANGDWRA